MSFDVTAEAYARFMGRFSEPLADLFVDWVGVAPGQRALDVGCGPGALTARLVGRLGAETVSAADPSEPFVEAARARLPGVDVVRAPAEHLPYDDGRFDRTLAQLVVHFMSDPVAGLREMARVTRPDGVVAASVWDLAGGVSPLSLFWSQANALMPEPMSEPVDESGRPGAREGHLVALFEQAGLREVEGGSLMVESTYATFEEWWEPYTYGVGPAGAFVAGLDDAARATLRERCRAAAGQPPFTIAARAWVARGRA